MTDVNLDERARDLAEFTQSDKQPHQPQPPGHALVRPTTGLAERVIGAQPVAVYRDEAKILQKLKALAAAAGSDWFYRFPVKNRQTGTTDWIEGPSIKLANDVARIFGNNVNEVREIDVGDAWTFYARFTDIETGFSMERAYRQRKSQTSMRTKDADRQLDIAYQIGQSKAIRNCIVNSLQLYADYAFEEARNSLVEKIGKDINGWRDRAVKGLANIPVELARVERIIGRAAKDWLAPNIAQVVAMMKSIADGMATVDEVFPPIEQEPEQTSQQASRAAAQPPHADDATAAAGSGGAQGQTGTPATDMSAARETSEQGPAAADQPADIAAAYQRGKEAKAAGHQRRAMPGEYRDVTRLALAWTAGFDGAPMPTFTA